jgi:multiple sugar transport system permease protein
MTSGWWVLGTLLVLGVGAVLFTKKARKVWPSYLFVGIPIFMAAVFVFFPAAVALYLSFTAYHPVMPLSTAQFIGLENYQTLVGESEFWDSIVRTLLYAVMTVPIGILLALIFAFLLNNKLKGERLWRFLYFAPLVTSVVSVSLIFVQLFLSGNQGWLNALLLATHAIINPIEFLKSSTFFPYCVVVVAIWQGLAFSILIFLAALQQVPESLYEAAEIDGASRRRKFWNIAVPSLRPQVFFVAVLGLIGAFQVFETIYMLAGKSGEAEAKFGPNDSGQTLVPLLYHKAFEVYQMGASSAIAYVLFFMLLLLTIFQWVFYRRREQLT